MATIFRSFVEVRNQRYYQTLVNPKEHDSRHRDLFLLKVQTVHVGTSDLCFQYPCPPKEEDCESYVELQGPYSPLEIDMAQLTAAGKSKRAIIESNSVNSVLLDESSDRWTRLLVAQSVNRMNDSNHLFLRNTTLLPNLPGFTALLALIFAPRVELRCGVLGTYYTGALCGLGPKDSCTSRGIFPDHDMEISFDVEISSDDLREVHAIAMSIDLCITSLYFLEIIQPFEIIDK